MVVITAGEGAGFRVGFGSAARKKGFGKTIVFSKPCAFR
jgi:hypothetical protein